MNVGQKQIECAIERMNVQEMIMMVSFAAIIWTACPGRKPWASRGSEI